MSLRPNGSHNGQIVKGCRVLVVDDNDDVADCLVMLLRRIGHDAQGCYSGAECLGCLEEFRPDVILLDISMPILDGIETCALIRRSPGFEDVPVIACSALAPYTVQEYSLGCDFSYHLVKPVSLRELQVAIEEVQVPLVGECRYNRPHCPQR